MSEQYAQYIEVGPKTTAQMHRLVAVIVLGAVQEGCNNELRACEPCTFL